MKHIKKKTVLKFLLVSTVSLMLLSGCFYVSEYNFKMSQKQLSSGTTVNVRLIGSLKSYYIKVNRGSPYEILIWFSSEDYSQGTVYVEKLELIDAQTKEVVFTQDSPIEQSFKWSDYSKMYVATISIDGVEMEYRNMVLRLIFSLKQGDKVTEYNVELPLEKKLHGYITGLSV